MNKLPRLVDPFALPKKCADFKGNLSILALTRLCKLLVSTSGQVNVELSFRKDANERVYIQLGLKTELRLVCQRCGEPVSCDINVEQKICPVLTDAEAASVQRVDDPWVTYGEPILVALLVEEEILLSLPMVAKHEECPVEVSRGYS